MEQLIYTPDEKPNENVIKAHDELLNASFGWGSNIGILGLLFTALFNPNAMMNSKHPFPNINDEEWNKEMENAIKRCVIAKYIQRGGEGTTANNELGKSASFYDPLERMQQELLKGGKRRIC